MNAITLFATSVFIFCASGVLAVYQPQKNILQNAKPPHTSYSIPNILYPQTHHALLIGIGEYAPQSEWPSTAGDNDARDMAQMLIEGQGFAQANTQLLVDTAATKQAILNALDGLRRRVQQGHSVVLFFSGHGLQVPDATPELDETDGMDEALAPYDSPNAPIANAHISDDELHLWMSQMIQILGPHGHLTVIVDACFSGDANRNVLVAQFGKNGSQRQLSNPKTPALACDIQQTANHTTAPWVFIAASDAGQLAGHLPGGQRSLLTHFLLEALASSPAPTQYFALNDYLQRAMAEGNYLQRPRFFGDINTRLFGKGGSLLPEYCTVTSAPTPNAIEISGWPLLRAKQGTTVAFYPSEITDTSGLVPSATGVISDMALPNAVVRLNRPLPTNWKELINQKAFLRGNDTPLSLHLSDSLRRRHPQFDSALAAAIPALQLADSDAELALLPYNDGVQLVKMGEGRILGTLPLHADSIAIRLRRYLAAQALRELDSHSEYCNIEVTLRKEQAANAPLFLDSYNHRIEDQVWLHIKNTTSRLLYFNVLEIFDTDEVNLVYPHTDSGWMSHDCYVEPGQTRAFSIVLFPAGRSRFKIVATNGQPFSLSSMAKDAQRGSPPSAISTLKRIRASLDDIRSSGASNGPKAVDVETVDVWIQHAQNK